MDLIALARGLIEQFGVETILIALVADHIWLRRKVLKELKENSERDIDTRGTLNTIGKVALRLEIVNPELPTEERIAAYNLYTKEFNGNGYMHIYYDSVLRPLAEKEQSEHIN